MARAQAWLVDVLEEPAKAMSHKPLVAFSGYSRALYQPVLERQLTEAGVEWIFYLDKAFSWRRRTLWHRDLAARYPDRLLAFVDSADFLFLGSRGELAEAIAGLGPLSFAAQKDCWPHPEKVPLYERRASSTTPWRYLNACGPAGRGHAIAEAISYGWSKFPIRTDEMTDTDERFYTDLYLDGFGVLDQHCILTQLGLYAKPGDLTVKGGRVYNNVTGSRPVFLHVNWREPEGLAHPWLAEVIEDGAGK